MNNMKNITENLYNDLKFHIKESIDDILEYDVESLQDVREFKKFMENYKPDTLRNLRFM
jgi:hypothetical protein